MGMIKSPHFIKTYVCDKQNPETDKIKEAFKNNESQESFKNLDEFGLNDMFYDQKEYLSKRLFESIREKVAQQYHDIYMENIDTLNTMLGMGIDPPEFLTVPISFSLKKDIDLYFEEFCSDSSKELYEKLMQSCLLFKRVSSNEQMNFLSNLFEKKISCYFDEYFKSDDEKILDRIYELFRITWEINITMGLDREKNLVFSKLRKYIEDRERLSKENRLSDMDFNGILKFINIAEALNLNVDDFRDSLNPFKKN